VLLIVDMWHPELTEEERNALEYDLPNWLKGKKELELMEEERNALE